MFPLVLQPPRTSVPTLTQVHALVAKAVDSKLPLCIGALVMDELAHKVTPVVARNTVFFGGKHPSSVSLNTVPLSSLPPNKHFGEVMTQLEQAV